MFNSDQKHTLVLSRSQGDNEPGLLHISRIQLNTDLAVYDEFTQFVPEASQSKKGNSDMK